MPDPIEPRDIELMRRLTAGDEDAFLEFYRRHQRGVYRFALHMIGRAEAASDVVQETFLTLIRQKAKFDPERGAPAAFLFGIARNHVRKIHARESRYVELSSNFGEDSRSEEDAERLNGNGDHHIAHHRAQSVLQGLERAEAAEQLREAILTLPEHYREPVILCDLEGRSYEDAASLLECPVGTVRSRLNRARSILLEKLRPSRAETEAQGRRWRGRT